MCRAQAHRSSPGCRLLCVAVLLVWSTARPLAADYSSDFEPPLYSGSPTGVPLPGQDGWTLPSGSMPYLVYGYAGNQWGFVQNPTGGAQFISGRPGSFTFLRAEHVVDFQTRDVWSISYDLATHVAETPGVNVIGSFSLQPSPSSRSFIAKQLWLDPLSPERFKVLFDVFNPFGGTFNDQSPGPEWASLQRNHWYRQEILIDFTENRILSVTLTDLHTGAQASAQPTDWFLRGGRQPGSTPRPTAVRFFTNATNVVHNLMAWDNLAIVPEPACALAVFAALPMLARRRPSIGRRG